MLLPLCSSRARCGAMLALPFDRCWPILPHRLVNRFHQEVILQALFARMKGNINSTRVGYRPC